MEERTLTRFRIRVTLALAGTAAALALTTAPAVARERVITVPTPPEPGPAQFNNVTVHQFGPASGKRVLVLMPGTQGGAGDFTLDARILVKRIPDLQVWAIDRRTQALEDTSTFAATQGGQISLQQAFDYYLGWLTNGGTPANHFQFRLNDADPYAREWGMGVALNDAHAVVQLARNHGRRQVVLGGHSLGASLTAAYAAWDFNGRPGYKDLKGLVLIDGGLLGSFDAYNLQQAQQQVADLKTGSPFLDLLGAGFPEIAGIFAEIGGLYAEKAPTAPATAFQSYPLLPAAFNPPFPVTNRALLGYAFDRDSSPPDLSLLHINGGALAASGDPRDWQDGGVTPLARLAETFGQEPTNAVEWYFPKRLTIDTNGADQMTQNDVANFLGLRLVHTPKVNLPLYAIATDLAGAHVLDGARNLIARSRITKKQSMLINRNPLMSHLDPLTAAPKTNAFLKTVVPFLDDKVFGEKPKHKRHRK
jgi:pimeloyl-ACP methyl ester carboxylesterase